MTDRKVISFEDKTMLQCTIASIGTLCRNVAKIYFLIP